MDDAYFNTNRIFAAISLLAVPLTAQDNRGFVGENFQKAKANNDDKLSPLELRVLIDENAKDEIGQELNMNIKQEILLEDLGLPELAQRHRGIHP